MAATGTRLSDVGGIGAVGAATGGRRVPPARVRPDAPHADAAALLIGAGGVLLRLVLLIAGTPPTNGAEAAMGLAAGHIAHATGYPSRLYGQPRLGTVEAYLAAPLVAVFGGRVGVLRLVALGFFALLVYLAYRLTRALYTPGLAVLTVLLLSLGSDRVLRDELTLAGGYPEILPAGAALMLLSVWLTRTHPVTGATPSDPARARRRTAGFAGWGLLAGLCLWTDWLILPYLGLAAVLLLAGCGTELRQAAGLWLTGGLVLGAWPLIADTLYAGPGLDILSGYARLSLPRGGGLGEHVHSGLLLGVPAASGLCGPSSCGPAVLAWGVLYPVLLVSAGGLAVLGILRTGGDARLRQRGRLALVLAAAVTLLAYLPGAGGPATPLASARYLHPLLISLPAVLWPVWRLATGDRSERVTRYAARAGVAVLVAAAALATGLAIGAAPGYHRLRGQQADLIAALDRTGVDRLYSDAGTCDRITFATGERIVCAVLADDLRPGPDRYPPYRELVDRARRPGYAFPAGSPADRAFRGRTGGTAMRVLDAGGYHLYLPDHRLTLG